MVGVSAAIQAFAASVMVIVALGGVAYRITIRPIKRDAEDALTEASNAMSKAQDANATAESAEETAEDVAARVDKRLDDIDDALDGIEQSLAEQSREARGRTFTLYRLTEAIRESDDIETDKIPHVDEDDILRGSGDRREGSDD